MSINCAVQWEKSLCGVEAYSCSNATDKLFWTRAVMTELFDEPFDSKEYALERWPAGLVTDCKSMLNCVTRERVQLTDRSVCHWMLPLTTESSTLFSQVCGERSKDATTPYAREGFGSNLWKLGSDERAPCKRNRSMQGPEG